MDYKTNYHPDVRSIEVRKIRSYRKDSIAVFSIKEFGNGIRVGSIDFGNNYMDGSDEFKIEEAFKNLPL